MRYTIKQGKHYSKPRHFGIFIDKRILEAEVVFKDSCKYHLDIINQMDTNKLFGIGYFWSAYKNSARFGWRYNPKTNLITLIAYCYVDGVRSYEDITEVPINMLITCKIIVADKSYNFEVTTPQGVTFHSVPKKKKQIFGFPMNIYFGGDQVAPHDIHIDMTKH